MFSLTWFMTGFAFGLIAAGYIAHGLWKQNKITIDLNGGLENGIKRYDKEEKKTNKETRREGIA